MDVFTYRFATLSQMYFNVSFVIYIQLIQLEIVIPTCLRCESKAYEHHGYEQHDVGPTMCTYRSTTRQSSKACRKSTDLCDTQSSCLFFGWRPWASVPGALLLCRCIYGIRYVAVIGTKGAAGSNAGRATISCNQITFSLLWCLPHTTSFWTVLQPFLRSDWLIRSRGIMVDSHYTGIIHQDVHLTQISRQCLTSVQYKRSVIRIETTTFLPVLRMFARPVQHHNPWDRKLNERMRPGSFKCRSARSFNRTSCIGAARRILPSRSWIASIRSQYWRQSLSPLNVLTEKIESDSCFSEKAVEVFHPIAGRPHGHLRGLIGFIGEHLRLPFLNNPSVQENPRGHHQRRGSGVQKAFVCVDLRLTLTPLIAKSHLNIGYEVHATGWVYVGVVEEIIFLNKFMKEMQFSHCYCSIYLPVKNPMTRFPEHSSSVRRQVLLLLDQYRPDGPQGHVEMPRSFASSHPEHTIPFQGLGVSSPFQGSQHPPHPSLLFSPPSSETMRNLQRWTRERVTAGEKVRTQELELEGLLLTAQHEVGHCCSSPFHPNVINITICDGSRPLDLKIGEKALNASSRTNKSKQGVRVKPTVKSHSGMSSFFTHVYLLRRQIRSRFTEWIKRLSELSARLGSALRTPGCRIRRALPL
ncbi:unnamed protein product [Nesidiocoris tenuis]|uniref:Uncharacterized protein n=1 Tax=Nesidiocoris tenuis TaxID=355587 RepID=A0A6H5HM73_9HEMI|nr:unnamed protein product [Nesidiocoris tenuis]